MSTPHIFDQEVAARPCRASCQEHVHVQHLSAARDDGKSDLGGGRPSGWTAQGVLPLELDNVLWFTCDDCDALVSEYDVEGHRCG